MAAAACLPYYAMATAGLPPATAPIDAPHEASGGARPRRHSHTATPALCTGVHFLDAKEGSLKDLADKALGLLSKAIDQIESDLAKVQGFLEEARVTLPMPTTEELDGLSGSDRAIYVAVQEQTKKVTEMIKTLDTATSIAATGH